MTEITFNKSKNDKIEQHSDISIKEAYPLHTANFSKNNKLEIFILTKVD